MSVIHKPLGDHAGTISFVAETYGLHRQTIYSALSEGKLQADDSAGTLMLWWADVEEHYGPRPTRFTISRDGEEWHVTRAADGERLFTAPSLGRARVYLELEHGVRYPAAVPVE